jgi:hypothetical protein
MRTKLSKRSVGKPKMGWEIYLREIGCVYVKLDGSGSGFVFSCGLGDQQC